jgi:preprotein translocase subunit YajC
VNQNDLIGTVFPLLLIVLAFWLLVLRPARKRQQEMGRVQSSVAPGSEVMLASGIFGTVSSLADDSVMLEIAPGTVVKVARQAVVRVVEPATADTDLPAGADGGPTGKGSSDAGDPQ